MIWFWYMVVHVLKKIYCVIHIFPIRGHSFLPNDADFHLFSNARRTILADIPEDWDKVVLEVRKTPKPFILEKPKQEDFFNIKDMLKPYFRANYGKNFKLRQVRMYKIDRDNVGEVIAKQNSFFGSWERFKILKKNSIPTTISYKLFYNGLIPLKGAKKKDVIKLCKYLQNPQNANFYENLPCDSDMVDADEEDSEGLTDEEESEGLTDEEDSEGLTDID